MAITLRSYGVSPGADSTTCVIVKPSGLTVGDLMVAQVITRALYTAITDPADWTEIRQEIDGSSAEIRQGLFWKIAGSGDVAASDFTFTCATGENKGAITAWTGHDSGTPINAHNGAGIFNTAIVVSGITPSVADCVLCFFCGICDLDTVSGYAIATDNPASWDEEYELPYEAYANITMAYASRPETSATGNATATCAGYERIVGQIIAIAPEGWTLISHDKGVAAAAMSHKKGIAVASISHVKGVAV